MRRTLAAAALLILVAIGPASSQVPPYVHGGTLSTSQVQVLSVDQQRRKIIFFNPNASTTIAFCPAGPNRDTGAAVTCAVNGAGSITLLAGQGFVVTGQNGSGPVLSTPSAWNGIAASGGATYTILDFE